MARMPEPRGYRACLQQKTTPIYIDGLLDLGHLEMIQIVWMRQGCCILRQEFAETLMEWSGNA